MKTCTVISNVDGLRADRPGTDYGIWAIRLARSIRANGGRSKDIGILFWYSRNNPPSQSIQKALLDLDCTLAGGQLDLVDKGIFSKLSACQLQFQTDYTMYIDTDSYVMGDFTDVFQIDTDLAFVPPQWSEERWARDSDMTRLDHFYQSYGCQRKNWRITSQIDNKECNFYAYTTVLIYKNWIDFGVKWKEAASAILRVSDQSDEQQMPVLSDPVPMCMAVQKYNFSYSLIPLSQAWNWGAHEDRIVRGNPAIVHCQGNRFEGVKDEIWNV
jgi:hypothetical protein